MAGGVYPCPERRPQTCIAGLRPKAEKLLLILAHNPFEQPPRFEKLLEDLKGAYSRRINIHHRLVYQVIEESKIVKVLRMWTHYE
jgi:toxin YoeB